MFQIEDFEAPDSAQRLVRLQLRSTGQSSYDELWLQRLIASHPQVLPIAEIEPYLEGAVPVCIELGTAAGFVDVVLITPHGDLVLVECKLWRNPQARREVVGQIIDYAKELPRLSYEAFDIAIQKAEPGSVRISVCEAFSVSPPIGQVTVSRERPPRQARILADPCSLVRSKHLFLRPDLAFRRHRAQAWSNSPLAAGPEPRTAPAWGRAWRGPTI
jgi:hypothetical protein